MYKSKDQLPESVKGSLPPRAQELYRKAYNSALETYKNPEKRRGSEGLEETASKVAWSAVKREYVKANDETWRPKE